MDPDQTAPPGAVWSESTLFDLEAAKTIQQTTNRQHFLRLALYGLRQDAGKLNLGPKRGKREGEDTTKGLTGSDPSIS